MSRFLEYREDRDCYIETLEDADLCRHLINDVCCNSDNDALLVYPYPGRCAKGKCKHFEPEPTDEEELEALRRGVIVHE